MLVLSKFFPWKLCKVHLAYNNKKCRLRALSHVIWITVLQAYTSSSLPLSALSLTLWVCWRVVPPHVPDATFTISLRHEVMSLFNWACASGDPGRAIVWRVHSTHGSVCFRLSLFDQQCSVFYPSWLSVKQSHRAPDSSPVSPNGELKPTDMASSASAHVQANAAPAPALQRGIVKMVSPYGHLKYWAKELLAS